MKTVTRQSNEPLLSFGVQKYNEGVKHTLQGPHVVSINMNLVCLQLSTWKAALRVSSMLNLFKYQHNQLLNLKKEI